MFEHISVPVATDADICSSHSALIAHASAPPPPHLSPRQLIVRMMPSPSPVKANELCARSSSNGQQKLERKHARTEQSDGTNGQRFGIKVYSQAAGSQTAGAQGLLKWVEIGSSRPHHGTEIKNRALAEALQTRREFHQAEFDKMMLCDLNVDSYILVRMDGKSTYFRPDGATHGASVGIMKTEGDNAGGANKVVKEVTFNMGKVEGHVPPGLSLHHRAPHAQPSPLSRSTLAEAAGHATRRRNAKQSHDKKDRLSLFEMRKKRQEAEQLLMKRPTTGNMFRDPDASITYKELVQTMTNRLLTYTKDKIHQVRILWVYDVGTERYQLWL